MQSEEEENKMTNMNREMQDTVKQNNLCVTEEDREMGAEKIFEGIMDENLPNLMKNINLHICGAQ